MTYKTTHLDLNMLSQEKVPSIEKLIYLWFNGKMLGHFFYEPKKRNDAYSNYLQQIIMAIEPTIKHLLENKSDRIIDSSNWQDLIRKADFTSFQSLLTQLFLETEISKSKQPITIIICSNNKEIQGLRSAIDALLWSISRKDEIIVVDYSTSLNKIKEETKYYPETVYCREKSGKLANARNLGIQQAKNSIVAFTDESVCVSKAWVEEIRHAFTDKEIMAMTGLKIPVEIDSNTKPFFNRHWGYNLSHVTQVINKRICTGFFKEDTQLPYWGIAVTGNMAFRKSLFCSGIQFDNSMKNNLSDTMLFFKIFSKEIKYIYHPNAYVYDQNIIIEKAWRKELFHFTQSHSFWLLSDEKRESSVSKRFLSNYKRFRNYRNISEAENRKTFKSERSGVIAGLISYIMHNKEKDNIVCLDSALELNN